MSHHSKSEILSGVLQQILFSPKGGLEGLLINSEDAILQVSMKADTADAGELTAAIGQAIEVEAVADHSPKTKQAAHPVYTLTGISKVAGRKFKASATDEIRGVVSAIHFAKHGEPNGVILECGTFVHTRPHGMKQLKLKVGSKVVAHGELRKTVLGTSLVEAREVNRVTIE